jgi:hypothetical protein
MNLSEDVFIMYRKGMDILKAQEALMGLKISCAPDMKQAARDKLFNKISRAAYQKEPVAMTPENLAAILNV